MGVLSVLINEVEGAIDNVMKQVEESVGVEDAIEASKIAVAAKLSVEHGRPVKLNEIGTSKTPRQLQPRLEPVK